jgi:hypothetical protein
MYCMFFERYGDVVVPAVLRVLEVLLRSTICTEYGKVTSVLVYVFSFDRFRSSVENG